MAKGKAPAIKFADEEREPQWVIQGRVFAQEMARIKLEESQREVELALRNYNIERKFNG